MKKERRPVIMLVLLVVLFTVVAIVVAILKNQGSTENVTATTERRTEEESSDRTQALSAGGESKENETIFNHITMEKEEELLKETKFGYMYGMEYEEEKIPRRFGFVVEEDLEEREIPLQEEDFKKLRKGQYFGSGRKKATIPVGIVDVVGMFDGQIMHTPRNPGTGTARTSPYYKINDSTYVILFFENNVRTNPLDHIEVWDAEGNKLRDIEID